MDTSLIPHMREHQDNILVHMNAAQSCLRFDQAPDPETLGKMRWELARLLSAYEIFKHTRIFDPALASGDANRAAAARRMKIACIALGEDFRAHCTTWSCSGTLQQWSHYRLHALDLLRRLREQMLSDRREVETLWAQPPAA